MPDDLLQRLRRFHGDLCIVRNSVRCCRRLAAKRKSDLRQAA